jgi:hypothetical protein
MRSVGTETFVLFDAPIKINKGKFFISYKINGAAQFCVYNTTFGNTEKQNTAWVKDISQGWIPSVAYSPAKAVKTSLAIEPLTRGTIIDSVPEIAEETDDPLFFDSKNCRLSLRNIPSEPVDANIYSLTGTLMEKLQFKKGKKTVSLTKKTNGTIGIVRLILPNKTYSKKIIY